MKEGTSGRIFLRKMDCECGFFFGGRTDGKAAFFSIWSNPEDAATVLISILSQALDTRRTVEEIWKVMGYALSKTEPKRDLWGMLCYWARRVILPYG